MKKRRLLVSILLGFILALVPALAPTISDNTLATFQNGTFANTTANASGVYLDSTELSLDGNAYELLHFNENSGAKAAGTNGRINFSLVGNATWTSSSRFGASAISLDGNDDYAVADAHYLSTLSAATIEFWFRLSATHSDTSEQKYLWQYYRSSSQYTRITLNTDGKLHYRYQRSGLKWDIKTEQSNWTASQWYHLAVVCGSGGAKIYINGIEEDETDSSTDCFDDFGSGFTLYHVLGSDYSGGNINNEFLGSMDEMKIANRTLSPTEIQADMRSLHGQGTYTSRVKDAGYSALWQQLSLNWSGVTLGNNLTIQAQSCDDAACDGESFIGPDNTSTARFSSPSINMSATDMAANRYFRYRVFFTTNQTTGTPLLANATITYENSDTRAPALALVSPTSANNLVQGQSFVFVNVTSNENLSMARLEWNGTNETMLGSGMHWYVNKTGLASGTYGYRVYGNDTAGNWNVSETRNVTIDANAPDVTLQSPADRRGNYNGSVTFTFTASDENGLASCSLMLNGAVNQTVTSPANGQRSMAVNLTTGRKYDWGVRCVDQTGKQTITQNRTFSAILMANFNGKDISSDDLAHVSNFYLDAPLYGSINYTEPLDLSNVTNIDRYITLGYRTIFVNSTALPILNKQATLQMRDVDFVSPEILRDGVVCPETVCTNMTYANLVLTFHVSGFSEYRSREGSPSGGKSCDREHELELPDEIITQPNVKNRVPITIRNTGNCALYDITVEFIPPTGWGEEQSEYYLRIYRHKDPMREMMFAFTPPRDTSFGSYHATVRVRGKKLLGTLQIPIYLMPAQPKREEQQPRVETIVGEGADEPLTEEKDQEEGGMAAMPKESNVITGNVVMETGEEEPGEWSKTTVFMFQLLLFVSIITFLVRRGMKKDKNEIR